VIKVIFSAILSAVLTTALIMGAHIYLWEPIVLTWCCTLLMWRIYADS
jgi:hypothetical protein